MAWAGTVKRHKFRVVRLSNVGFLPKSKLMKAFDWSDVKYSYIILDLLKILTKTRVDLEFVHS